MVAAMHYDELSWLWRWIMYWRRGCLFDLISWLTGVPVSRWLMWAFKSSLCWLWEGKRRWRYFNASSSLDSFTSSLLLLKPLFRFFTLHVNAFQLANKRNTLHHRTYNKITRLKRHLFNPLRDMGRICPIVIKLMWINKINAPYSSIDFAMQ
jgi:hypothetical protein